MLTKVHRDVGQKDRQNLKDCPCVGNHGTVLDVLLVIRDLQKEQEGTIQTDELSVKAGHQTPTGSWLFREFCEGLPSS